MDVVDGIRPKIISGTPLKYKELMEQCWSANPEERSDIDTLLDEISEMNKLYYEQQTNNSTNLNYIQTNETSNVKIINFNSKVYSFKDLPEPRNTTKDIVPKNKSEQDDLQISIENDKEKNEFKRIHPNISDGNLFYNCQ
ncbi:hypothetical protein C1645_776401 [Glomus cerebriforme]|uniref:Serine-threonine/tyrosine-protein kinase catalytic domain-containing protein n=1 Tax=Glomus cerebriforme TaxID=658196 RepID=A0A397SP82_9GLOM|nr:hypothetical protein C1645_776401 [Glomus cerebriforme]